MGKFAKNHSVPTAGKFAKKNNFEAEVLLFSGVNPNLKEISEKTESIDQIVEAGGQAEEEEQGNADAVLTKYSNPCGVFDTSTLPPLLNAYVNHICATTNADSMTVTSNLIGLISGFLKKSVYIRQDDGKSDQREVYFERLHVNLYQLSVLPSGLFKSTGQKRASEIGNLKIAMDKEKIAELKAKLTGLTHTKTAKEKESREAEKEQIQAEILALNNQSPFLSQRTTAEGLLQTQLGSGRAGTILLPEFGTWLQGLQKSYNLDLKAIFTELYDVPDYFETTTKGGGTVRLERPFLSICGLSTIDWVKKEIRESDVSSGFFARFLIFSPPGKMDVPPAMPVRRPGLDKEVEGNLKDLLFNHLPTDRAYKLSEEAYGRFQQIHSGLYSDFEKLEKRLQSFWSHISSGGLLPFSNWL